VRGECTTHPGSAIERAGPSPRARGVHSDPTLMSDVMRTIPACAGSADGQVIVQGTGRDHPRVRGECKS